MMNRRDFLAATVVAAASADAASQLALNGGVPVRTKPLVGTNWGPQYYDDKERTQINEVLESRNGCPGMPTGTTPPQASASRCGPGRWRSKAPRADAW